MVDLDSRREFPVPKAPAVRWRGSGLLAWPQRFVDEHKPMRSQLLESEAAILKRVHGLVSFELLAPRAVPFGYRLARDDLVPHDRSLAALIYEGRSGKWFRFAQRARTFPLIEELEVTRVPHSLHKLEGLEFYVVHGAFVGEPGDSRHWHTTRRSIAWEQEGSICEIAQVIDESPSLWVALRIAASVGEWACWTQSSETRKARSGPAKKEQSNV
jgi:hypothetical protein